MNILVTGGAGFIGSHVVELLVEAGHRVAVVDNLWEHGGGKMENVRDQALAQVFRQERPEVVCHLAAQHSVKLSTEMPTHDAKVNVLGLINLLQCCTQYKVRKVVFSSSAATYGTAERIPVDEATPQRPESPYGITKLAGELYLEYWKREYALEYTALRYGNVYGPRQDPTGEAGVVAIFAHAILNQEPVRIDWDGEQQRDFVYVGDVARANLLSLSQGDGEAYCIATGEGTSINRLYRELVKIIGYEPEIIRAPKRPGDVYLTYFDCSKASRQLGWTAQVSLEEGLRRTVDCFKASVEADADGLAKKTPEGDPVKGVGSGARAVR
jgi:UDP-glucose 4-epimerase